MKKLGLILVSTFLLVGCAADNSLYYWGRFDSYRETVYQHLNETIPLDEEIQQVSTIIAKAKESDKGVPPGMYAHLGMLYSQQGNQTLARDAFIQEKTLFPESSHFVDYLMNKQHTLPQRDSSHKGTTPTKPQTTHQEVKT